MKLGTATRHFGFSLFFFSFHIESQHSVAALAVVPHDDSPKNASKLRPTVAIVGGGLSGLVVGNVLSQSGNYDVHLFEKDPVIGGNVRCVPDPKSRKGKGDDMLNIGHASHMGMFWNLRLMLEHLDIDEWPVGRGRNDVPGLFRMLSVDFDGTIVQPPLEDVLSPFIWLEAIRFYFYSYLEPEMRLDEFLKSHIFSEKFLNIMYWSMATFEFDKRIEEAGEYALGAARALLITQVFFKFLLCDEFDGVLPAKIDSGLKDELRGRAERHMSGDMGSSLLKRMETRQDKLFGAPLASYFSADYTAAMKELADGIGCGVSTNCSVTKVVKQHASDKLDKLLVCTEDGKSIQVDSVIFTTQPSIISNILSNGDFPSHVEVFNAIEGGAVGVQICHESGLPFPYPPSERKQPKCFSSLHLPATLGIFDISQLTIDHNTRGRNHDVEARQQPASDRMEHKAGWLSIAYPVYRDESFNRHLHFLAQTDCCDKTIYPWIRASSNYPALRRKMVDLQGCDGIHVTGHTLTSINKASELQVTNALQLCHEQFGCLPPWGAYISTPLLPDCNDEDAFKKASSVFEAIGLAWKSLVGSFLLLGVVSKLGVDSFE